VLLLVAYGLEMLSLRRLTAAAFGTLMALEPAAALLIGAVGLHQVPDLTGVAGMALVVAAGVGATRAGARPGSAGGQLPGGAEPTPAGSFPPVTSSA
jgi:inner membrane transporter RhtA